MNGLHSGLTSSNFLAGYFPAEAKRAKPFRFPIFKTSFTDTCRESKTAFSLLSFRADIIAADRIRCGRRTLQAASWPEFSAFGAECLLQKHWEWLLFLLSSRGSSRLRSFASSDGSCPRERSAERARSKAFWVSRIFSLTSNRIASIG